MMTGRRVVTIALSAMLMAGVLAGCASGPDAGRPPATPTSVPTMKSTTPPDEVRSGAEAVALSAMHAFVNHGRPQAEWWNDFSQYLAPEAVYVWEGVRADRVAASTVTGDPITTVNSGTSASVLVTTDAGQYRLQMTRRVEVGAKGGPWLVFEMTPPAGS